MILLICESMNVAIDTSVIIAIIVDEPKKPAIIRQTKGMALITPESVEWEIGNAFSAMLKRNRIDIPKAIEAINIYQQLPIRFANVEIEEAIKLAGQLDIYAYDAYLIRCAMKYQCPLLTLDHGLRYAAGRANVTLIEV